MLEVSIDSINVMCCHCYGGRQKRKGTSQKVRTMTDVALGACGSVVVVATGGGWVGHDVDAGEVMYERGQWPRRRARSRGLCVVQRQLKVRLYATASPVVRVTGSIGSTVVRLTEESGPMVVLVTPNSRCRRGVNATDTLRCILCAEGDL